MKKLRMLSGVCVAGMLMVTGITGCSNETKSNANQQESRPLYQRRPRHGRPRRRWHHRLFHRS